MYNFIFQAHTISSRWGTAFREALFIGNAKIICRILSTAEQPKIREILILPFMPLEHSIPGVFCFIFHTKRKRTNQICSHLIHPFSQQLVLLTWCTATSSWTQTITTHILPTTVSKIKSLFWITIACSHILIPLPT